MVYKHRPCPHGHQLVNGRTSIYLGSSRPSAGNIVCGGYVRPSRRMSGRAFSFVLVSPGLGVVVPYDPETDTGYRSLGYSEASLRAIIRRVKSAPKEERNMQPLDELFTLVRTASRRRAQRWVGHVSNRPNFPYLGELNASTFLPWHSLPSEIFRSEHLTKAVCVAAV